MNTRATCRRSTAYLGTIVTIEIAGPDPDDPEKCSAIDRAFEWFALVERTCTRFDPDSELMRLSRTMNEPREVSVVLFEAVRFALALAKDTNGAFDPTIGLSMERRGFDREHRTRATVHTPIEVDPGASFRDVTLDETTRSIALARPLVLDLGGVAKGLAIDMAAAELAAFPDFAIDAGGDVFMAGHNAQGRPWSVGIRHPRLPDSVLRVLDVSGEAVCTSGDYERVAPRADEGHHILSPATREAVRGVASVTVIAPTAMLADGLSTAAFVLGPVDGLALLARHGVDGLIVEASLAEHGIGRLGHEVST